MNRATEIALDRARAAVRRGARRHRTSASNSSRPRPRRWQRRCGSRSRRSRRWQPRFVSVTYGAGGSTRERTHATVERIVRKPTLTAAAHLTCVGATREEIDAIARSLLGRRRAPHRRDARRSARAGREVSRRIRAAIANAAELVAGLKQVAPFEISVAAYPECHPDSPTRRRRPRQSQAQDRRRRRPGDHPVLLLGRLLLPLPRQGRGGRHRHRDRARHPAGHQRRRDQRALRRDQCGAAIPDWLGPAVRGPRRAARRRASWSPRRSPPSCAASSMPAASATSISTRSTGPSWPTPSATCWECGRKHERRRQPSAPRRPSASWSRTAPTAR